MNNAHDAHFHYENLEFDILFLKRYYLKNIKMENQHFSIFYDKTSIVLIYVLHMYQYINLDKKTNTIRSSAQCKTMQKGNQIMWIVEASAQAQGCQYYKLNFQRQHVDTLKNFR